MAVNQSGRKRVIVNFKNTPEDIALYQELKRHSSISGYIKDILRGVIILKSTSHVSNNMETTINDNTEELDVDDILGGI